jgi:predicted nucleic acid-binding protein
MLFLDTSAIVSYKREEEDTVSYLEGNEPWFTSTISIYEFVEGAMWQDGVTAHVARQSIGGVNSIELSETVAMQAARMQNELRGTGDEMPVRDLLIAATARSTGAELVVADSDFQTGVLENVMQVTNLAERSVK